jgi:hypothetical protein
MEIFNQALCQSVSSSTNDSIKGCESPDSPVGNGVCTINGTVTGRAILRLTRLSRFAIGWLLNRLGFPGFLYDDAYVALNSNTGVSVRRGPFFTVVTINGLDIYFHRLTGKIDGIGFNPAPPAREQRRRPTMLAT